MASYASKPAGQESLGNPLAAAPADAADVASVTVTFNPDIDVLGAQLRALPEACCKLVVDNGSDPGLVREVVNLLATVSNTRLVRNESNVGLAAALNAGVAAIRLHAPASRFALLLDQDSEPEPGCVEALLAQFHALESAGHRVGCVGPVLRDAFTGHQHGFHRAQGWRWRRVYCRSGEIDPVRCSNLNGSGTLVPLDLFERLGGLEADFFIDHVDTEWAFRVLHAGYELWGVPSAVMRHRMGQATRRVWWLGGRLWPVRSPKRHYFLFRNAARLLRRPYVPRVWKGWAVVKLALTVTVEVVFGPDRRAQARAMVAGMIDGMRGNGERNP